MTFMESKQSSAISMPNRLTLRQQSRVLEIDYEAASFSLPFEFLRVYSPSAEVRRHGAGQEILQTGQRSVTINAVEQVGNYSTLR